VGTALLVVLETLTPAERVAFVLHDVFAVPFAEIAPVVDRSPAAAKMLASRARHRVREGAAAPEADPAHQREIVGAFLAASREGDFEALLALLDPDVVLRADGAAVWAAGGQPRVVFDFTIARGKIVGIDLIAEPDHLLRLDLTLLEE
jgi:RNA polymerase sigma-70 factor (ECF subfamily)